MENQTPIVKLQDVIFSWGKHSAPVLHIEGLTIQSAQHTFLYGASGSGKSTLLNLLSGVMTAQQGRIEVLGQNLTQLSAMRRDAFRAEHIGVIFQQFNLLPYLSVQDNILLAAHFAKQKPDNLVHKSQALLEQLQLPSTVLSRKASELSVGQQQRVAVVRALINQPKLIIADEPTSALDSDARDAFLKMLLATAQTQDSTIVFVSHDRALGDHFDNHIDIQTINKASGVKHAA